MLPKRLPKPKRRETVIRSPGHLRFVRSHQCSVPLLTGGTCLGSPVEAAHIRRGTDGGVGMKPGDNWTISLCRTHHEIQHARGEADFDRVYRMDSLALAAEFWAASPARRRIA